MQPGKELGRSTSGLTGNRHNPSRRESLAESCRRTGGADLQIKSIDYLFWPSFLRYFFASPAAPRPKPTRASVAGSGTRIGRALLTAI
jgi:hypothetical protein